MAYLLLLCAISAGVTGTLCTRASKGFTRWRPALGALGAYGVATVMMALLVEALPVGVVYASWAGGATVALLVIDRILFGLRISARQLVGLVITLIGVGLLGTAISH